MIALVLKLGMARAHGLQRAAPDHEETGARVAHFDEPCPFDHGVWIVDLEDVSQGGRRRIGIGGLDASPHPVPIDALDRIDGSAHVGAGLDQSQNLFGFEADIGIKKQQVGRRLVLQELRQEPRPRPGDEGVPVLEQHLEGQSAVAADGLLQLEEGCGIEDGDLSAKARGRDHKIDLVGRRRRGHEASSSFRVRAMVK